MVEDPKHASVDDTPKTRAAQLVAVANAAKALYGNAGTAAVVSGLPDGNTAELEKILEDKDRFIPESVLLACYRAVFVGPSQQNAATFRTFIARVVEEGFGAADAVRVTAIAPSSLLKRAADLWRSDHTHGELAFKESPDAAELTWREHPFVADEVGRSVLFEFYRAALGHTVATRIEVTAEHADDFLLLRFRWAE